MKIPVHIQEIITTFEENGYEAYVVGGAVRDSILGIEPFDFDITTNCSPQKTIELFEKTVPTGIKHGTVTVISNGIPTEVTTYRIDGEYLNSRAPESVRFTDNLELDLMRRDFTINAMAYSKRSGLIDIFGGKNDLINKTVKTVGVAEERFKEDALRILRAIRFACQLEFSLEPNTFSAAVKLAPTLSKISGERIYTELSKALLGKNGIALEAFIKSSGLAFLGITEAMPLCRIFLAKKTLANRFYIFFRLTNADYKKIAAQLKFSNNLRDTINAFYELNNFTLTKDKPALKKILNKFDADLLFEYIECEEILNNADYSEQKAIINDILTNNEPYKISMLNINGNDLIPLGFSGAQLGEILNKLVNICMENPELNCKSTLINLAKPK